MVLFCSDTSLKSELYYQCLIVRDSCSDGGSCGDGGVCGEGFCVYGTYMPMYMLMV